jgi:hypothetical protein
LLILGIGLMVLSRLMKTSDSKEFPSLDFHVRKFA